MKPCEWCRARMENGVPGLCEECKRNSPGYREHIALDVHVDTCPDCRNVGSMCEKGSRLRADALAADGRLDRKYAETFGWVDPQAWFDCQGQEGGKYA